MIHVSLAYGDEIGNEIEALLQEDINVRKGPLDFVAKTDEPVVNHASIDQRADADNSEERQEFRFYADVAGEKFGKLRDRRIRSGTRQKSADAFTDGRWR